jgi:alpha-glucosidase (family GH31 glycosyl hydrolase)
MILLFAFIGMNVNAQSDTLQNDSNPGLDSLSKKKNHKRDTLIIENQGTVLYQNNDDEWTHSPQKALIYSLVLPGLGQAYNKKYWKIPIVYGVMGGAGYWVYFNNNGYKQAIINYNTDPSDPTVERYLRAWRRNLELSYIVLVGTHALQVLDAFVDASLFYWDVNPELGIRVEPSINPLILPSGEPIANYGFRCKLTF